MGIASVIVRDCPALVPFQHGWTIAQIFIAYVPRIVWKDKPDSDLTSGQWVTDQFGGGPDIISSTGATWMGELWFNFGWPGIVIGMLLMGLFLRVLHEILFKPDAEMPAQLMSVITLFRVPTSVGGALIAPVNGGIFSAMPLMLAHWSVRLMSGTLRPTPARDERSADLATQARAEI